ncbi:MAG: hypothetical protein WAV11_03015 [Minisyncoccia bacterium]
MPSFKQNQGGVKRSVYDTNRRWQASRLDGSVKNFGTRMVRKPKATKSKGK